MTPNQRRSAYDPTASYGINRAQVALRLIQLGDNMRLRADLGQPVSQGQLRTYNEAAYDWDHRIPQPRKAAER